MDFLPKNPQTKTTPANTTAETTAEANPKGNKGTKYLIKTFVSNCDTDGNWPEDTVRVHGNLTTTKGLSLFINPPKEEKGEPIHFSDMKECQEYMAKNKVPLEFKWLKRIVDKVEYYIFDNRPSKNLFLEHYEEKTFAALQANPNYQAYMDDKTYTWSLVLKEDGTWVLGKGPDKVHKKVEEVFVTAPKETTLSDITKSKHYKHPVLKGPGGYEYTAKYKRRLIQEAKKEARDAEDAEAAKTAAASKQAAKADDDSEPEEDVMTNSAATEEKETMPEEKAAAPEDKKAPIVPKDVTKKAVPTPAYSEVAAVAAPKPVAEPAKSKPSSSAHAASKPVEPNPMGDVKSMFQQMVDAQKKTCDQLEKLTSTMVGLMEQSPLTTTPKQPKQPTQSVIGDAAKPPPAAAKPPTAAAKPPPAAAKPPPAAAKPPPAAAKPPQVTEPAVFVPYTEDGKRIAPVAFTTASKCFFEERTGHKCNMRCGFSHVNASFVVEAGEVIPESVCDNEFAVIEDGEYDFGRCTDPSCTSYDHVNDRRGTVIPKSGLPFNSGPRKERIPVSTESIARALSKPKHFVEYPLLAKTMPSDASA
jgi:hypothetical protein